MFSSGLCRPSHVHGHNHICGHIYKHTNTNNNKYIKIKKKSVVVVGSHLLVEIGWALPLFNFSSRNSGREEMVDELIILK